MYTFEDDQETSSTLRQRDILHAQNMQQTQSTQDNLNTPATAPDESVGDNGSIHDNNTLVQQFSPQQITSSLKQLTTPAQASTGSKGVALAALTVACISVFFTAMDQTVVVTALPPIINDLNIGVVHLDHAAWIISAYLLGFVIAMPLMGRVSDIFGRRRIFLLCLSIFGIGSLLCGIAPVLGQMWDISFLGNIGIDTSSPGLIWLIAARFVQAIGGGAVVPVAMAIAGDFYGQERRGLALGIIGAVTEAGGVIGPLYGALIVQQFGWQYIFFFNIPIVIVLLVLAWLLIPRGTRQHEGIDWIGALLLGIALTCLSLGLAQQGTDLGPVTTTGATPQNNPIALALAGIFLIAFFLFDRKVRWPVVDLALFKRFAFTSTALVSLLVGAALIIAMADIPIFVDTVLQRPVIDSGLALLRLTAMIPVGALLGGWLCSRVTCRVTGVIGLLFTAVGFYLMSRWPIDVGWTQITISTMTAGLGFGLVIAPIGTTALNAVKASQAGMGSAIVTSLRMVGMMLGLAALTSWALAYFKQLAGQYQSLPLTATAAQFAQWSKGYAAHLIQSAHTVYSMVFFISMVLCLIAILPAIFLWGNKAVVAEQEVPDTTPEPEIHDAITAPIIAPATLDAVDTIQSPADTTIPGEPPIPPIPVNGGNSGNGRNPKKRRRLLVALACLLLVLLLIIGGVFAAFMWQSNDTNGTATTATATTSPTHTPTATPIAGPRMIQLALDSGALTSLFVSQLNLQQGTLSNLHVVPTPQNGIVLSLNLNINSNGIQRVMPLEIDGTLGIDKQQNIQLNVIHLKRDGLDAGAVAAANMQVAMNQLMVGSVMPALRTELKNVKLISARTSTTISCGMHTEMLVLLIQAPPIQGIAAQPVPISLCFKGPIDINKLLPN
ncbi:MAG TPA: MFS transporter [Ktedonobacteraceae bacterium]|nr:MFS transporter [Ktedonobacteraceae bacterium]